MNKDSILMKLKNIDEKTKDDLLSEYLMELTPMEWEDIFGPEEETE